MRFLTDYFDSDDLYFIMDAVLIGLVSLYAYSYSDKKLVARLCLVLLLGLATCQIVNIFYMGTYYVLYINYLPFFTALAIVPDVVMWIERKFK